MNNKQYLKPLLLLAILVLGKYFLSTSKTYLEKTLIFETRSMGKVMLAFGVSSLILTAHSKFKIPTEILENSTCSINRQSKLAKLIESTTLVV